MRSISVIIPVYNVAPYLKHCIESVLHQTWGNFELILVDDGSLDGSEIICDKYMETDKRVKVIHQRNQGLVAARKKGLFHASGDFIAYVDGDDWIEPTMLEQLYCTMVREDVDIVMCGRYEDTGAVSRPVYHGIKPGRYGKQELLEKVYPRMIVNGAFFEWGIFPGMWDKLFKRECLERFQMTVDDRLTMGEDAACTYPCLLNADCIFVLQECLYHYRQTTASMVKQKMNEKQERERFQILYHSVKESFTYYKDIYDLTEQWKKYVLFLMVPRADILYPNVQKLDYLFPFPKVKKGSNIIIYGMGTFGQHLYKYVKNSGFCKVVVCVDKNYIELRKLGIPAEAPENIANYNYDAIVVAISFANARNDIYKELSSKYFPDKVHIIDEKLINSDETLRAFGLI